MPIFRNKKGEVKTQGDDETRQLGRNKPASGLFGDNTEIPAVNKESKTILHGRPPRAAAPVEPVHDNAMNDPVIGWLVIIKGPGQGNALKLGYGQNNVGRSDTQRVCLNYGDDEVSREQHCIITYDPRSRKYHLINGTGANLTYLNDAQILAATELKGNEVIDLGQTQCRFVPLCGEGFDWQDMTTPALQTPAS